MGKSQTKVLLYVPSNSEVNATRQTFFEVTKYNLYGIVWAEKIEKEVVMASDTLFFTFFLKF